MLHSELEGILMSNQAEKQKQLSPEGLEQKQRRSEGDRLRELILVELSDVLPAEAYMLHPQKKSE